MSSSPGVVTPPANEAFRLALEAHLRELSSRERKLFAGGKAEDVLELARLCEQGHVERSKSLRFARVISGAVEGLKGYFGVIETVVSSHPEIAAIVWGGVKFIIEVHFLSMNALEVG